MQSFNQIARGGDKTSRKNKIQELRKGVQLATAGELIITSIVIIIISLSPLLERLPVCAAAALIAGAGTNCPFYIQKHYLVHFHSTKKNTHSQQTDTVNINHVLC